MKRNFISLTALALCCALNSYAQYSGGSGTEADPYLVATAEDLQNVSNNTTSYFKQTDDIDLDGVAFSPIETFTGQYDGDTFTIDNLTMESGANGLGLFARVNAPGVIKNVIIRNASVSGGQWIGILCSTNGNWEAKGGTFKNCYIFDSAIDGGSSVAAFAGVAGGSFENCHAYNVTVEATGSMIGGISGDNENGGHYSDCTFYGEINGNEQVGGIVGFYNGNCDESVTIQNCVTYGSVTASSNAGGGLVGTMNWNTSNFKVENSCSFANVSGIGVGGIAGADSRLCYADRIYSTGTVTGKGENVYAGGLFANVPFNTAYSVKNAYCSGTVSAGSAVVAGAVTGCFQGNGLVNVYYSAAAGMAGVAGGLDTDPTVALDDMTKLANYTFEDASKWQNIDGVTTPFFANQTAPTTVSECTTNGVKGSCSANLLGVYICGSLSGSLIDLDLDIASDGTWSVTFGEDEVAEGETLNIIMIDHDCMPSMVTKAKVVKADADGIETVGNKAVKAEPVATYNIAGQRNDGAQKGICIVKMSNGKTVKVLK